MSSEERHFLHELSHPVAVCFGIIKIVSVTLENDPSSVTAEFLSIRLGKALDALEMINNIVASRREQIVTDDSSDEKKVI